MTDPRIKLRNPVLAAVLAFLLPGAGHLYQRRYFKAAIYSVCVLGIYFWGCSLGEAKSVHFRWDSRAVDAESHYSYHSNQKKQSRQRTIGYLAQVGVGLPALPALVQRMRYDAQLELQNTDGLPGEVLEEFNTEFTGRLLDHITFRDVDITGQIAGVLQVGDYSYGIEFIGRFEGQTSDGKPVSFDLLGTLNTGDLQLGHRITGLDDVTMTKSGSGQAAFSGDRRRFHVPVVDKTAHLGIIEGTIPRPFYNHLLAPLNDESLQHLNGKLGKRYELALVYTWIAGLLNILAIWDALQGPAYGYGDEEPETEGASSDKKSSDGKSSAEESSSQDAVPTENTSAGVSS